MAHIKGFIGILIIFILSTNVSGAYIYIKINDLTNDYEEEVDIFQDNNLSFRYSQTENLSDISRIGGNISYDLVITPKYIEFNPEGDFFIVFWIRRMFIVFIFVLFIGLVIGGIYHMVKKR